MATKVSYQINYHAENDFTAENAICATPELAAAFASYILSSVAVYKSDNGTSVFAHQVHIDPAE